MFWVGFTTVMMDFVLYSQVVEIKVQRLLQQSLFVIHIFKMDYMKDSDGRTKAARPLALW